MSTPDIEARINALITRIKTLQNTALAPAEPLVRSAFEMDDAGYDETPHPMPTVGVQWQGEPWSDDRLLGLDAVSQEGRHRVMLLVMTDAAKRGSGYRGNRGAFTVSRLLCDGLRGWEIESGAPVTIHNRERFDAKSEGGELLPIASVIVELSYPVYHD